MIAIITGASARVHPFVEPVLGVSRATLTGPSFPHGPFMDMGRRGLLNIFHAQLITLFAFVGIEGHLHAATALGITRTGHLSGPRERSRRAPHLLSRHHRR